MNINQCVQNSVSYTVRAGGVARGFASRACVRLAVELPQCDQNTRSRWPRTRIRRPMS
jgi:hypothetical protein